MSKEDLIQICGLADGIRMFNILHTKWVEKQLNIIAQWWTQSDISLSLDLNVASYSRVSFVYFGRSLAPRLTLYATMDGCIFNAIYLLFCTAKELQQKIYKLPGFYEFMAKGGASGVLENGSVSAAASALYNNWGMHSKYSGSGSNIFNDVNNKSCVYILGPSGVHVSVSDEVLNNEIKDRSFYALDVQGGKVILKSINKQDNN